MLKKLCILIAVAAISLFSASCGREIDEVSADNSAKSDVPVETANVQPSDQRKEGIFQSESDLSITSAVSEPEDIDYQSIKPYEVGQVMVIMYHAIVEGKAKDSWERNIDDFKNDLQTLYDEGYRLCSLKDLTENKITTEAGYTPVVITFDDGLSKSFSLVEKDGNLVPKENTGIYIMEQFAIEHPGFGHTATFYINGYNDPFSGDGTVPERLQWLIDNGYDIGNHTYSHAYLDQKSSDDIQMEIGKVDRFIKESVPGYVPVGVSYPYGRRPSDDLLKFILHGEYEGKPYDYTFALKEGYNAAKPSTPNRGGYDVLSISRVRGSSDADTDLGYFLKYYKENPQYRYISDGNPDTITVEERYKDNVDLNSLGDKKLIIYTID